MSTATVASRENTNRLEHASRAPGVVRVRQRAIDKVVREASADTIGVPRDEVRVEVTEWGGGLAVRVSARMLVPHLEDLEAVEATVPVLDRVRRMQSEMGHEFARLTGREIRRISVNVTGAIIPERKRVR